MNKYGDLLRDPRWQKKRTEILNRDKFTCQLCGDNTTTLNVHHLWYGKEPWDVPSNLLITLCEPCHKKEENIIHNIPAAFKAFSEYGLLKTDMMELCIAAFENVATKQGGTVRQRLLKIVEAVKTMK